LKPIDEFVLDYANRDMAGIDYMKSAEDKGQVGVLDIRTNAIEKPEAIPHPQGPPHVPAESHAGGG
jgi:methionine synthase II (cobalamin-independent)